MAVVGVLSLHMCPDPWVRQLRAAGHCPRLLARPAAPPAVEGWVVLLGPVLPPGTRAALRALGAPTALITARLAFGRACARAGAPVRVIAHPAVAHDALADLVALLGSGMRGAPLVVRAPPSPLADRSP